MATYRTAEDWAKRGRELVEPVVARARLNTAKHSHRLELFSKDQTRRSDKAKGKEGKGSAAPDTDTNVSGNLLEISYELGQRGLMIAEDCLWNKAVAFGRSGTLDFSERCVSGSHKQLVVLLTPEELKKFVLEVRNGK